MLKHRAHPCTLANMEDNLHADIFAKKNLENITEIRRYRRYKFPGVKSGNRIGSFWHANAARTNEIERRQSIFDLHSETH